MSLIFESFVKILYKPETSANLVCSPPPSSLPRNIKRLRNATYGDTGFYSAHMYTSYLNMKVHRTSSKLLF